MPPTTEIIVDSTFTKKKIRYGLVKYPNIDSNINRKLIASPLIYISRNINPVSVVNMNDMTKVMKEGEVLAICVTVTCINRNCQSPMHKFPDTLVSNLLKKEELNDKKRYDTEWQNLLNYLPG